MGRIDDALMRAALLRDFAGDLEDELLEAAEEGFESPFDDLPGVWLDEIESAPTDDEPIVVLCPRAFYADTFSPVLLDDLLFGHRTMAFTLGDEAEA